MAFRAVIFDLYGTLVAFSPDAYNAVVAEMARVLTASPFEFAEVWRTIVSKREPCAEGTIEDDLNYALQTLNAFTRIDQRRAAIDLFYDFERRSLQVSPGTVKALTELRLRGLKLGVVSNTVPVIARLWPVSELGPLIDSVVFSSEVGVHKPATSIYRLVAQSLGVATDACLFVSAGDSYELEGAEQAGMRAIRIARTGMSGADPAAPGAAPWKGRTIARLEQIIEIATP